MERWSGKTAVVTGASSGIGAAVALALANAGMCVVGVARRQHLVEKLKSEVTGRGALHSRQCDVSKPHEVATTFKWIEDTFGGTDLLVNNAAVLFSGHITNIGDLALSEDKVLSTIDVNIKGVVLCLRHALASMKKRGFDGHIININSICGHYVPTVPLLNVYTCTKHAITGLTAALSNELAQFGSKIKTTSISPGLVATDMVQGFDPHVQMKVNEAPTLQAKDVADAVLYVVSTPANVNLQ